MPAITIALVTAVVTWAAILVTGGIAVSVPRWATIKTAFQNNEKKFHRRVQRTCCVANDQDSEQSYDRHGPMESANTPGSLWFPSADEDV